MSEVSHSLADVIQCIVHRHDGVLFPGDQVVKTCYQDGCVVDMEVHCILMTSTT